MIFIDLHRSMCITHPQYHFCRSLLDAFIYVYILFIQDGQSLTAYSKTGRTRDLICGMWGFLCTQISYVDTWIFFYLFPTVWLVLAWQLPVLVFDPSLIQWALISTASHCQDETLTIFNPISWILYFTV